MLKKNSGNKVYRWAMRERKDLEPYFQIEYSFNDTSTEFLKYWIKLKFYSFTYYFYNCWSINMCIFNVYYLNLGIYVPAFILSFLPRGFFFLRLHLSGVLELILSYLLRNINLLITASYI